MRLQRVFVAAIALLGTGCATVDNYRVPPVAVGALPPVVAASPPSPAQANGAIFQAAAYRPLFEDHRARLPGDTLTVQIVEKVSASQKSTSSIDKSGELNGAITALPLLSANSFNRATAAGSSSNTSAARAPPKAATISAARSPCSSPACCPTAIC